MNASGRKSRITLNLLITALMLLGWVVMAFRYKGGALTAAGLASLKFFTVQSNVFRGIVSLILACSLIRGSEEDQKRRVKKLTVWNYMSTCCVGLTFLVVFAFFGPLYGLPRMLVGANFFFHLVIPVLSMVEFVVFNEYRINGKQLFFAGIPPLIYGFCYLINLLVNGIGYGPKSNDWYGFAIWGIPIGLCIFAAICVVSILIGLILNTLNKRVCPALH